MEKNESFVRIGTKAIYDDNLSLKAKGLYYMIKGVPPDWHHSERGYACLVRDGRTAVSNAMRELEKAHYLKRERVRNLDGKYTTRYTVYDKPDSGFTVTEFTVTEEPMSENPANKLIDITSIKQTNIKENISESYTDLLTTTLADIEHVFGRRLSPTEISIWESWKSYGIDPRILSLAIKDNEFRKDKLTLEHVEATLRDWKERGLSSVKKIKNHIFEKKYQNTCDSLRQKFPVEREEEYQEALAKTDVGFLHDWREDFLDAYWNSYKDFTHMNEFYSHLSGSPKEVFQYIDDNVLRTCAVVAQKFGNTELKQLIENNMEGGGVYGENDRAEDCRFGA